MIANRNGTELECNDRTSMRAERQSHTADETLAGRVCKPGTKIRNRGSDWGKRSARYQKYLKQRGKIGRLAADLGLSEESLSALEAGYDPKTKRYTFPEKDATGRVIGLLGRDSYGKKQSYPGSARGLSLPTSVLRSVSDILYIVEGPTDVAALTQMGLPAVGRPGIQGGQKDLLAFVRRLPSRIRIIVVGENDCKKDGRWPGKVAAQKLAEKITDETGFAASCAQSPDGAKDPREWLSRALKSDRSRDALDVGREFAQKLNLSVTKELQPWESSEAGFISTKNFLARKYPQDWLVRDMIMAGQPVIIGGPKKSLKTTFVVALAAALASGADFLGQFRISKKRRVGLISGESGEYTLQKMLKRICRGMRIEHPHELAMCWKFKLPCLSDSQALLELSADISRQRLEVVIIDPLYLCLLAGNNDVQASNLYQMGPLMLAASRACINAGATPILVHHARKQNGQNRRFSPLELDDLSYAGISEFARQWVLLSRREKYDPGSSIHRLWMSFGGSTGVSGLYGLDVQEGLRQKSSGKSMCKFNLLSCDEVKSSKQRRSDNAAETQSMKVAERVLEALAAAPNGETANALAKHVGIGKPRLTKILDQLTKEKRVELTRCEKPNGRSRKKFEGYRLTKQAE